MFKKIIICANLVLFALALAGQSVAGQPPRPTGAELIEPQLEVLRSKRLGLEEKLRLLRDGDASGLLMGYFFQDEFYPLPKGFENPAQETLTQPVYLPMKLKTIQDTLTIQMLAGELTQEEVIRKLADLRIGAAAKRTRAVREGIERAERDYREQLASINTAVATLEAVRERLLFGAANPAAAQNVLRIGTGILKDEQGVRPIGQFEIKKEGQRSRLILAYAPNNKITATEESIDPVTRTVVFKFEYHLPEEVGKLKTRGPAKLDFRTNKVTLSTEEVFDSETNTWRGVPRQTSTHVLVWEEKLEDARLLSKSGKLEADAGKNNAEISFTVQERAGADYTFELKAPATRLTMKVELVGGSKTTTRTMPERGKPARFVGSGPNQGVETYRITVIGVGPNLPANYELEVWERWRVNGNVPPLSWDSESGR